MLVYFGWPRAHEGDAERAVHAGLELVAAVGRLRVYGVPLAARVGIATGLVMIGDLIDQDGAKEEALVGETPNLAARVQTLAEPGTVVVADGTRDLLGGLFEYQDLGMQRLKGFAKPLRCWRVVAESAAEGRFEALYGARLTPLVGREEEIALLLRCWGEARDGEGQAVLLAGEPGIGKSRVARGLLEALPARPLPRRWATPWLWSNGRASASTPPSCIGCAAYFSRRGGGEGRRGGPPDARFVHRARAASPRLVAQGGDQSRAAVGGARPAG